MNVTMVKSNGTPFAALALLWCFALVVSCANLTVEGGGADVGNPTATVRGSAEYENSGASAAGAFVFIRGVNYVRAIEDSALPVLVNARCNDSGSFRIDLIIPGVYLLEIRSGNGFAAIARCTIVDSVTELDLGRIMIKPVGTVRGVLPEEQRAQSSWFARIFGTDRIATVNQRTGAFSFPDLPEGIFVMQLKPTNAAVAPITIDTVKIRSGAETFVSAYPQWRFSRALKLNTTATGAEVNSAVVGFPVLVRLTSSRFDFGQALRDGGDVRFTNKYDTPLSYEIERWDPVTELAEVWVKVDTVYGNDSTQFIKMYWGNPNAANESNGAAVFDTSKGFAGVWHLGETGDSVRDAAVDGFDGINSGAAAAAGMIGNSMSFANGNYLKIPGLLRCPTTLTLSAWVRSDKTTGQDIVSLGDAALIRFDDANLTTAGCYHNDSVVNDLTYAIVGSGRFLAKTGWHYLAFSIDAAAHVQTLYIDGVPGAVAHYVNPINYAGLGTDTYIGVHGNGKTTFNFVGQIDEVCISRVPLSSDWIKLCFMNQKAQDALVQW
jgi:hypothetical protein